MRSIGVARAGRQERLTRRRYGTVRGALPVRVRIDAVPLQQPVDLRARSPQRAGNGCQVATVLAQAGDELFTARSFPVDGRNSAESVRQVSELDPPRGRHGERGMQRLL